MNLTSEDKERIRGMKLTLRELRIIDLLRDYKVLRSRHFGTSIPPVEEMSIQILSKRHLEKSMGGDPMGFANCRLDKDDPPFAWVIGLAEEMGDCETRLTLLHEMAHVKVNIKHNRNMEHGKQWQREMKRLASVGAFDKFW